MPDSGVDSERPCVGLYGPTTAQLCGYLRPFSTPVLKAVGSLSVEGGAGHADDDSVGTMNFDEACAVRT